MIFLGQEFVGEGSKHHHTGNAQGSLVRPVRAGAMVTIQSGAAGTLAACAAEGVGAGESLAKPVVGAMAAPITAPTTTMQAANQPLSSEKPLECQTLVMPCGPVPLSSLP